MTDNELLQSILIELQKKEKHEDWERRNNDFMEYRESEYQRHRRTLE